MRKLNIVIAILIGFCMAVSCNNQGKLQKTSQAKTANQKENEDYSDDEYDDEIIEETVAPEVDPNGYKWLEGVWAASDDYGNFARIIITDTYMQMISSNWNDMSDKVEDQPKEEYNVEIRYNDILDRDILSLNDYVGIDVANHRPYVVLSEYSSLSLNKIEGQTLESSIAKSNQLDAKGIHGITDQASYTWADENLYGRVLSYVETEKSGNEGYRMTKKFNEEGKIIYFHAEHLGNVYGGVHLGNQGIYPMGIPEHDKLNDKGSQTKTTSGLPNIFILDHNLLNPAHMIKEGRSTLFDSYERTYQYDAHGNIAALYANNQLLYEFEYDENGRLLKKLENGKPRMKITWSYNFDPQHVAYSIKLYSPEGYNAGEYKYAWKSNDVLASIWNDGEKELFSTPEFTFYNFPKVKTVRKQDGVKDVYTACYFYDEKGHLSHVVQSTNKPIYSNLYGTPKDYYQGVCKTYTYDDKGNVCSENTANIYWPSSNNSYNDFIKYIFNYNFNQLPAPKEETIWRYKYDEQGNWVQKDCYKVKHGDIDIEDLEESIKREYEYY